VKGDRTGASVSKCCNFATFGFKKVVQEVGSNSLLFRDCDEFGDLVIEGSHWKFDNDGVHYVFPDDSLEVGEVAENIEIIVFVIFVVHKSKDPDAKELLLINGLGEFNSALVRANYNDVTLIFWSVIDVGVGSIK
jgi:hypothetical protein